MGTLIGGWIIHRRLDGMVNKGSGEDCPEGERFKPYMGVCAEITAAAAILQTGVVGIPMSTNHAVVSSIAGAKSGNGSVHLESVVKVLWGWVITCLFCFFAAFLLASLIVGAS